MNRREAVAALLRDRGELLVVCGLGSPSYDVHAAGDHAANFYLWGAMGGAALVGLGLAQAQRRRPVLAITGDGEQLMGVGGLATIAVAKAENLSIVVLDNQHFGETGLQRSHTGHGVDLAGIATSCGFPVARTIAEPGAIEEVRQAIQGGGAGPRLFVLKVTAENLPRSLPIRDAVHLKNRFRNHLGLPVT